MLWSGGVWMEVWIRPWHCLPVGFWVVFLVGIESSAGLSRFDTGIRDVAGVARSNFYIGNGERLGQTARGSSSTRRLSEIRIPGEF